jgi:tetratricopeptide (TPR) repeat protein
MKFLEKYQIRICILLFLSLIIFCVSLYLTFRGYENLHFIKTVIAKLSSMLNSTASEVPTSPEQPSQVFGSRVHQRLLFALLICLGMICFLLFTNLFTLFSRHPLSKKVMNPAIMPTEYKMLGDLAIEHGKFQLAERCYHRVAELDPYNRHIHYEIGELLFQTGRYAEAIEEFKIALNSSVIMPEIYAHLACAYQAVGQPDKAEIYYQKTLQTAPHIADKLKLFHHFKRLKLRR